MSRYRNPYTLFKRGKYWYYRTYDRRGIRTTAHTTGCTSRSMAKAYCDKLYLNNCLIRSNVKFYDYAVHFYDDNAPYVRDRIKPLAENTLKSYRTKMKINILPYFKEYLLADISYSVLKDFRSGLIEKGYAANNIVSTMSCLKQIIETAYKDRIIIENPFEYLESITVPTNTRDSFTFDEIVFILQTIPEEFRNLILLMCLTGMRIGEAIGTGLGANQILYCDKGYEYIKLENQYNLKKIKPVKMDSRRPVPITPEIKALFGFEPLRISAFYREFQPVKQQIENYQERQLSFHSLRHFFITNTKSCGCVESKVEFVAGHKLTKKNEQRYTNYKPEDLVDIHEWQVITYKKIQSRLTTGTVPTTKNYLNNNE